MTKSFSFSIMHAKWYFLIITEHLRVQGDVLIYSLQNYGFVVYTKFHEKSVGTTLSFKQSHVSSMTSREMHISAYSANAVSYTVSLQILFPFLSVVIFCLQLSIL